MTDPDDIGGTEDDRIIAQAKRRYEYCVEKYSYARENSRKDTIFANGDSYNMGQWDQEVITNRNGRPCLTTNKARQHNLQIVNDARKNKAQVKVSPTGGKATYEAAEILSACIRRIEAQSKAPDCYSTAAYYQVESGKGYCRVLTRYVSEKSFDQDLFIVREPKPQSIYLDPDAQDYDKADMRYAFKFRDMPRDEFREEYGEENVSTAPLGNSRDSWDTKDHVRVAEYFRRLEKSDHLHMMDDGSVLQESTMPKGWKKASRHMIQRSREISRSEVEWFLIAGSKIIDRKPWPSRYIPIVPWIGEEVEIDGKLDVRGHTRALLDGNRIYNYASSAAAEFVGLQTKTPYIASAESIEGFEADWESANIKNKAVLFYNGIDDQGRTIQRPEREKPPISAPAYMELMATAEKQMMMASGQYQENFGQQSNAQSGVAISMREREGDNATFHYIDNQAKAIRQIGRILIDMIPRIYDVARVIKIMAEDGTQSEVHIDPNAPEAHQHVVDGPNGPQKVNPDEANEMDNDASAPDVRVIFNPLIGEYDVEADVGPSFATQREEAQNAFTQIMAQHPDAFAVVGDFWAENSDFPGSDKLAERLRRGIPKQYQPGPSPEVTQMQQQLQQVTQHGQQIAMQADHETLLLKQQIAGLQAALKDKDGRTEIEDYKAMTNRFEVVGALDPDAARVMIRSQLSGLLGMPALPVMQAHAAADAAHEQAIAPPPDAGPPMQGAPPDAGPQPPPAAGPQPPPMQSGPPMPMQGPQ